MNSYCKHITRSIGATPVRLKAGAKEALSLYLVFDKRIGNGFMKREGKRATQVRKPFFQKGSGPLESQPCFSEGNRICAELHTIPSHEGEPLGDK